MTIFLIVGKFSQSERSYQNSLLWLAEISKTKKQSQIDAKLYPFIPKIWLWIRLKNFSIFWIIIFLKNEEKRANTIFHRWKIFYFNKLFCWANEITGNFYGLPDREMIVKYNNFLWFFWRVLGKFGLFGIWLTVRPYVTFIYSKNVPHLMEDIFCSPYL